MIRTINKLLILAAALSGAACGEQAGTPQETLKTLNNETLFIE